MIVVATVSRAGLIISDIIVIAVTWGALRNSSALARPMHTQRRRSLIAAMLWNGTYYRNQHVIVDVTLISDRYLGSVYFAYACLRPRFRTS